MRIPESKIEVIANGIDTAKFRPLDAVVGERARKMYGLGKDDFVIVLPGRIDLQKNHMCLVNALSQMDLNALQVRVRFFGNTNDCSLKARLVDKIRDRCGSAFELGGAAQRCS